MPVVGLCSLFSISRTGVEYDCFFTIAFVRNVHRKLRKRLHTFLLYFRVGSLPEKYWTKLKRVILLGAGFAVPTGGPTTANLTDVICSLGWPKYLLRVLKAPNNYSKPNFEDVLGALEMELSYYKDRSNRYSNTPACLFKHKKKQSLSSIKHFYRSSLDFVCVKIIDYINGRNTQYDTDLFRKRLRSYVLTYH